MVEYLKQFSAECPDWLKNYKKGDHPTFKTMLKDRFVYYPGACHDGQPIMTCNMAFLSCVYFYVDCVVEDAEITYDCNTYGLKGYNLFDSFLVPPDEYMSI